MDNNSSKSKKKFNFSQKKDSAILSIKQTEYFLRNLNKAARSMQIFKFFK
jgi:hypothetical protein